MNIVPCSDWEFIEVWNAPNDKMGYEIYPIIAWKIFDDKEPEPIVAFGDYNNSHSYSACRKIGGDKIYSGECVYDNFMTYKKQVEKMFARSSEIAT